MTEGKNAEGKNAGTKILFSDMDGTLLKNDSTVSPETKQVLDRMTAAGHRLVLTSGRPLDSMLEVMEQEGLFYPDTLLIAYNGSLTWDCTAQAPLFSLPLPLDICRGIADAARRHGVHYQTYTDHEIVCEKEDEELFPDDALCDSVDAVFCAFHGLPIPPIILMMKHDSA